MSRFQWTDRAVCEALDLPASAEQTAYGSVSTDTRAIARGDLFVALVGERFDGHEFLERAAQAGAIGAVVSGSHSEAAQAVGLQAYPVADTLVALGRLARHRRRALGAQVVGITGSTGKTTTKELARGAVAGSLRTHATLANLNNRVGLPLTLLAAPADTEVLLLEMGTNQPGEIAALTEIAEPTIGVVTTVGEVHLEGLGTLEGVLAEKLALVCGLPNGATALVGDDPPQLAEQARGMPRAVRVAGWSERADQDLRPRGAVSDPNGCFSWVWQGYEVHLRIPGRAAVVDALLALAVSEELGVEPAAAADGVGRVESGGMRTEERRLGTLRLLVDCYNANPQSVRAALELLQGLPHSGPKVAVLGSMLELGVRSRALHDELLRTALTYGFQRVLATGAFAEAAPELEVGARLERWSDLGALSRALASTLHGDELVLLKGSRGVRLEQLIDPLSTAFAEAED